MNDYIRPELLILVPVLIGIGTFVKHSAVDDRLIPLILGVVGIVLCTLWTFVGHLPTNASELFSAVFCSIAVGILTASAAVYGNQMVKQLSDKTEGDTFPDDLTDDMDGRD